MSKVWRKHWRGWVSTCVSVWAVIVFTGVAQAEVAETISSLPIGELPRLAEQGEFDRVLNRLREDPVGSQDPQAASLIGDLERFHDHEHQQVLDRRQAYQKAFDEMDKLSNENKLEDAMVGAIDAHSLSDDPAQMLQLPEVRELAKKN